MNQGKYSTVHHYRVQWLMSTLAKSNVVNQNKATASDPPQSENIDKIKNFVDAKNITTVQDIEYFTRNFAALGTYFSATAAVFQATALAVQNLLAEITPDTPDAHLPVEFNNWLRGLVATYPAGCTSRTTNTFNYYVNRMNTVNFLTGTAVPACAVLYYANAVAPQTFNFAPLIPPPPNLPACNIPGTNGRLSLDLDAQGNPNYQNFVVRIMGSGNTNFYALGTGASLAGTHYVANDLSTTYAGCQGVYEIALDSPSAGYPDAYIALNCNNQVGNAVIAPFNFVVNNQQLQCVLFNKNDNSNGFYQICGPSAAAATTCGSSMVQALQPRFPQASLSTASFVFHPL
ncbi:hypothetical protein MVEN_00722400 [Mycena venus]|uniref:Uncharacterized protein n=1 Tax=Mycena venus TaxID=2733690 RepID=A0A8H6YJQ5_9AGAR|nr:hypothetical protein MVEN_00722400 [Mycena venus]